jgi:iron complex transport system ATP-binding protein
MEVRGLEFSYGPKKVLRSVSASFRAGALTGLLGPNGSGKTTLFKCCLGLRSPSGGEILLKGRPLASYRPKELARLAAWVPQEHRPAFPFSVREMAAMGRTPHMGLSPVLKRADREAVEAALAEAGVLHLAGENYNHLSGGQRQLALVARALAQEAPLVFFDEPTSSLDFRNQIRVWRAVRGLAEKGAGAVVCCHDPNHILWFCDEAVVLKDGRVIAQGAAKGAVTQETLDALYEGEAKLYRSGGRVFVCPRQTAEPARGAGALEGAINRGG